MKVGNINGSHDYQYISFFVDILERILKIMKDIFGGLFDKVNTTPTTTEAPAQEA